MQTRTQTLLRRIAIGLTTLGLLDAGYLTYVHLAHVEVLCSGVGGCDTVQNKFGGHFTRRLRSCCLA